MNNSYYWQILPYPCLETAYEASKRIRKIKRDFFLYRSMLFSSKRSWQSILSYTNTELNNSVFIIYVSLLKYRIGLYLVRMFRSPSVVIADQVRNLPLSRINFSGYRYNARNSGMNFVPAETTGKVLSRKINRKLAWIEATLNDLYIWKRYYLFSPPPAPTNKGGGNKYSSGTRDSGLAAAAYESIGLLPRSITRTFSRFKAESMNQSGSLVLREFRLAKYQALASLQYIAYLIFIPSAISIFSQKCLLEPWISHWWDSQQSQVFLASFQEEKALEKLQEIEELSWLDQIIASPSLERQSQDLGDEIHRQIIALVRNCNGNSIGTILHLSTDIIYFITLSGLFILGKDRLVILNSWAQELFYSLSDTMKAFFILLLTDLCIGFHSPHGWEILISFCLERFGFVHNKHVISCFVSTFPVILDTVFKYLIFRHLNRISPSIVATYHTMNE